MVFYNTNMDDLYITDFGPKSTKAGVAFNMQADGSSAIWFEVEDNFFADLVVEFEGLFLKSARNVNVVSAIIPNDLLSTPRIVKIRIIDESRQQRIASVNFEISGVQGKKCKKSPCIKRSQPIPNFFIVGAPRSGTTSLYWRLRSHSDVHMSRIKEPFYFDERAHGVINEAVTDKTLYQDLYKFAPYQVKVIGEASTVYLSSPRALRKIKEYNPDAKILVVLRNPLTACISLYLQHYKGGVYEHAENFEQAWNECNVNLERAYIANYKEIYRIGDQLIDAIDVFGKENVKVVLFDDLKESSSKVYSDLLGFLNLDVDTQMPLPISNSAGWEDVNSIVSDRMINEMIEYFSPQIEMVSEKICRNLGHWNDINKINDLF